MRHDGPKTHGLEHRARRDAGLGVQAAQTPIAGCVFDMLKERPCDPLSLEIGVNIKHVHMPVGFEIREACDTYGRMVIACGLLGAISTKGYRTGED